MSRRSSSRFNSGVAAFAALSFWLWGISSFVLAQLQKTYDWTIELEVDSSMKDRFEFSGSSLRELSRVKVFFYKGTNRGEGNATHYEDLWYAGPQLVGIRRDHELSLTSGEQLVVKVLPGSGATDRSQCQGAADAIVRLVVDAYANKNMTSAVVVPAGSFNLITESMGRLNFVPAPPAKPDEPVYSIMILHVYSDPPGQELTMNYNMGT